MKNIIYNPETNVLVPREPTQAMCSAALAFENNKPLNEWGMIVFNTYEETYSAMLAAAPQPEPNHNWCAGCSPDNCSGCGAAPVESEPAMWAMKHIRSGDLAQAKPNQKALHPYMWSDAFPRYTTPQPDRTAELEQLRQRVAELEKERDDWQDGALGSRINVETLRVERDAALNEARDFESDVDTVTQHNVELQLETIALKSALNVARDALIDCEGALDECRDYPITYDTILEALAKINEVLK